ncbi:MAG: hypothetical protein ACFFHV_14040 [Promethearchaeota archaeon]
MTDTIRTTVTLTERYMNRIEKLVGKFATTRAQAISKIVENFLDSANYFNYLKQLEREKEIEENEMAKRMAKKPEVYDKRIKNIFSGANNISINEFLDYLNIDYTFFFDMLSEWKDKYNFTYENGKVFKIT